MEMLQRLWIATIEEIKLKKRKKKRKRFAVESEVMEIMIRLPRTPRLSAKTVRACP
jgi:hypothetical protein